MNVREILLAPIAYLPPPNLLDGLTSEQAEARAGTLPHSTAAIVAHLVFWQEWFLARCEGRDAALAQSAAEGWPSVAPGSWPALRDRFLAGLEALVALGERTPADRRITPAIEFPPLAEYTVGDALVHVATHNAHHLGQIVLLRQIQGTWPPPAGGLTW
jgi:uncharacterized damage-inducible protein DinB